MTQGNHLPAPNADLERAKKAVSAVYLATEASVADDLSGILRGLIAEIEYRRSDPVREELVRALKQAAIALDDAEVVIDADDCVETFQSIQLATRRISAVLAKAEGHTP